MGRYLAEEYILDMIADIYEEYEISELGFDPIKIVKQMGILVIPFNSFSTEAIAVFNHFDKDGFSWYNHKINKCEIYYNANIQPQQRIHFTISHELYHVLDGHIFKEKVTKDMEDDAHEFARQFRTPQVLLMELNITSVHEIVSTFNVTQRFAEIIHERLQKRIKYHGKEYTDAEKRILQAFRKNQSKFKK